MVKLFVKNLLESTVYDLNKLQQFPMTHLMIFCEKLSAIVNSIHHTTILDSIRTVHCQENQLNFNYKNCLKPSYNKIRDLFRYWSKEVHPHGWFYNMNKTIQYKMTTIHSTKSINTWLPHTKIHTSLRKIQSHPIPFANLRCIFCNFLLIKVLFFLSFYILCWRYYHLYMSCCCIHISYAMGTQAFIRYMYKCTLYKTVSSCKVKKREI